MLAAFFCPSVTFFERYEWKVAPTIVQSATAVCVNSNPANVYVASASVSCLQVYIFYERNCMISVEKTVQLLLPLTRMYDREHAHWYDSIVYAYVFFFITLCRYYHFVNRSTICAGLRSGCASLSSASTRCAAWHTHCIVTFTVYTMWYRGWILG